ncbi:MAG TPA: cysteine desulfurase [Anaerolineaceae bacterium]|nr:cysteine desulfurase [Anaerolineaceae bacterium]
MTANHPTKSIGEGLLEDFPILNIEVHPGIRLTYLDSAATSQKPLQVIEAMDDYYRSTNANIHRGVHALAEKATAQYEDARKKVADFIGSEKVEEVIFTRNTTESINLVANAWGRANLNNGDLVVLTEMEHHSNLVPWQMLAAEKSLRLEFIEVTPEGELNLDSYKKLLDQNPKVVAFTQMSNVLGTINPAREIISMAKQVGAMTLMDAAQSVPHLPVNVAEIDADFVAFSGHKMLGPTGIGVLWGKLEMLSAMPPFLGGGDMIKKVYLRSFTANDLPHKFEAGTPAIAEAIGLGAAVDYLNLIGMETIARHEQEITAYAIDQLSKIPGLTILGPQADKKGAVLAFTLDGVHPHDVAQILDSAGIAVRAGHHCAMPLHDKYNIPASTRASFYLYNTRKDVDVLVSGIETVKKYFG